MVSIKAKKIRNAFDEKGFIEKGGKRDKEIFPKSKRKKGSRHDIYYFFYNGKRQRVYVPISRSIDEYSDSLLSRIAKEIYLTKSECIKFIECGIEEEDYIEILKEKQVLSSS